MPEKLPPLITVVGPTAAGKTSLAILIARTIGGEVISTDSRQVYRGLNLLSGKATKKEMKDVPHHLLDVVSPKVAFSVNKFEKLAIRAIHNIQRRGKIPILCGGTGQYIDAVVFGLQQAPVPPNPKLRKQLEKLSIAEMFLRLKKLDPERAKNIDPKNRHRIERAIEVATALGKVPPLSKPAPRFHTLWIGVTAPREELTTRIKKRLDARLSVGMINEAKKLHVAGLSWKRFESFGLESRWIGRYLQNKITKDEMCNGIILDSRHYAKRQMTWFKRNKEILWHHPNKTKEAVSLAKKFLKSY